MSLEPAVTSRNEQGPHSLRETDEIFQPRWESMLDDTPPESGVLDPDKPNVVFIHAGASSLASFTSQFSDKRLTNAFNLIALDARLCGRTEGTPRERHVIEDSSYCLTYALDELGLEKYSLVGEEFHGCNCATWIAIKRPERVQSLLLASPGWLKEPQATINAMLNEFLPGAISNKNGNGDGSGTIPDETMQIVSDYYFGKLGREPERRDLFLKVYQKRYGTSQSAHDVNHVVNMFNRDPIPPELMATVKAPVLILQGADDAVAAPLQAAEEWQALFTNAKGGADLRIIAGAPLLLFYTDSSVANRFLLAFVQRNT